MSGTIINIIIELIAGPIGGNAAGVAAKDVSLGTAGNTGKAQVAPQDTRGS